MTNEAVLMIETDLPISMTCAEDAGIEKGTLLKIADPYTVSASGSDEDFIGGIAAEEKISGDGKTKIAVYRRGIFRITASGSITCGDTVASAGAVNKVKASDATCVSSKTAGIALETAADTETFLFELNPGVGVKAFA